MPDNSTHSDDLIFKIALTMIPGLGNVLIKNLVSYCGGVNRIFSTNKSKLLKIPGIGHSVVSEIAKKGWLQKAEKELQFVQKKKLEVFWYLDKDYPIRLKDCIDSPLILYTRGVCNFNVPKVIAIVGTRKPTNYGKDFCKEFVSDLAEFDKDILIVSGLAYGIDAAAHKAALESDLKTVAVLGHNHNLIYPAVHRSLAEKIQHSAALISEYSTHDLSVPSNFPMRNRIIAGMSDAVVVVQSGIKGGSTITARIAHSYNRDVFALPGKYNDPLSEGCNFLIKTLKAGMIESADDLLKEMCWKADDFQPVKQKELFIELNEHEQRIINLLKESTEIEIDVIARKLELSPGVLASSILGLEMKGVITSLPGKKYQIC